MTIAALISPESLGATDRDSVPLPVPLGAPMMVTQLDSDVTSHAHPVGAATLTLTVPPSGGAVAFAGDTLYEQPASASCTIVTGVPAIVTVPVRGLVAPFGATAIVAVPLPVPVLPAVTVSQSLPGSALQPQPVPAVTETVTLPPAAGTFVVVGVTAYEQAWAAWVTRTVAPAIASDPDRDVVRSLAATDTVTTPPPRPLDPEVTAIQPDSVWAAQEHPSGAVTVTVSVPSVPGTLALMGLTE